MRTTNRLAGANPETTRSDEWETPQVIFQGLDDIFHFQLDAAASATNAKCSLYYDEMDNSLVQPWHYVESEGRRHRINSVWLNPPYKTLEPWVKKAVEESTRGCTVVALLPPNIERPWFQDSIKPRAKKGWCQVYDFYDPGRLLPSDVSNGTRIKFVDPSGARCNPSKGNILVVFRPPLAGYWRAH